MNRLTRIRYALLLAFMLTSGLPRLVSAKKANCTDNYMLCINDSGQLPAGFREAGDVECAAEYVGCVGRKLKFW